MARRFKLWLQLICKECDEFVEVYCDAENAMMCPECRSVDSFKDPADCDDFLEGFDMSEEIKKLKIENDRLKNYVIPGYEELINDLENQNRKLRELITKLISEIDRCLTKN